MIHDLKISAAFETSGFTLDASFQPLTGITAVVGRNGSGKTFSTIEATRYLLFGKAALRGPAGGYKRVTASGLFTIRGEQYKIQRGPKVENIADAKGTILAVNPEAVTAKVTELMGYGLEVFDVCNASMQGQSHLFGDMKPAARKRMIDRVVGLTSYETIEKACRNESTTLRREVEALTKSLVVPVGPTAESPGAFSDDIEVKLKRARADRTAYDRAVAKLTTVVEPTKPEWPSPAQVEIDLVQRHEDQRRENNLEKARLQRVMSRARIFTPLSVAEIDAAEARLHKQNMLLSAGDKPHLTLDEIDAFREEWARFDTQEHSEEVTCPNCTHVFFPTGTPLLEPKYEKSYLREQEHRHRLWTGLDDTLPEGADLTKEAIANARRAIEEDRISAEAKASFLAITDLDDKSGQLETLRERKAAWDQYEKALAVSNTAKRINDAANAELMELDEPLDNEDIDALTQKLADARVFEAQWSAYDKQRQAYDALTVQIGDTQKLADEYKKGSDALSDARAEIKAFLAPAMSRVASRILSDMTNGEFAQVTIDDDMNVMVGAQTLETLSGGQATAANLALRMALGQVLVGDTFPVFLGDEIDSDVDEGKRESIGVALTGMKKHLQQIILVTHRAVDVADHVYDLDA